MSKASLSQALQLLKSNQGIDPIVDPCLPLAPPHRIQQFLILRWQVGNLAAKP